MTQPTVLTVILNYRTPDLALKAADAALREMADIAGEIVIVDNASDDGSAERIAQQIAARGWDATGRITLRRSAQNGGFGAGNNLAIRQGLSDGTRPDFIYLLNSDAWPCPGAIHALLEALHDHPEAGIAGSFIKGEDGAPHTTAFRFPSIAGEFEGAVRTGIVTRLLRHAVVPMDLPRSVTPVDWVAGASALMRARMLDEIGLFDETFFLYYEETDLCRRARRAGWQTLYVPQSAVVHLGSVSTGMKTWRRTPRYWFDSRRHYFTKNHGRAYAACATLARIAGAALWRIRAALARRPTGDAPHFLRDLIGHSLRGLLRRPARGAANLTPVSEDAK